MCCCRSLALLVWHQSHVRVQVLVGNKCDMDESKRAVPYSKGQALADELGIQFFETSAKTNTNVSEVSWGSQADLFYESCCCLCINSSSLLLSSVPSFLQAVPVHPGRHQLRLRWHSRRCSSLLLATSWCACKRHRIRAGPLLRRATRPCECSLPTTNRSLAKRAAAADLIATIGGAACLPDIGVLWLYHARLCKTW